MKESIGGVLNIFFLIVFLFIVEGILTFIVSYTKAFKMKNAIIAAVEKYEGNRNCFKESNSACWIRIEEQAKRIKYSPSSISCPNGFQKVEHGDKGFFCYKEINKHADKLSYRIVTQVDIDIPVIDVIMGIDFFQVAGDTRWIITPTNAKRN